MSGLFGSSSAVDQSRRVLAAAGSSPRRCQVLELGANARGRSKLTIDYTPRGTWPPGDVAFVEKLLIRYFEVFGCFRLIDTRLIGIWVRALRLYSRDELVWALAAKKAAMQPTDTQTAAFKRQFACAPDRFIDKIDYWLALSPDFQHSQSRDREGAVDDWAALTDEQRQLARDKTFIAFKRACSQTTGSDGRPLDPDHVEADRLQIDIALRYARGQGWLPRREK